jgi:hypothetical protein
MTGKKQLKIPYAVGNFEELIEGGYYLVDKTPFIRELETYKVPVFLRPRRFGKTLWCSILECYYDINRKECFSSLFGNYAIGKAPTGNQNSFMVLRFNFSKIQVEMDMEKLEKNFRGICVTTFRRFLSDYHFYFDDTIQAQETLPVAKILDTISEYITQHNLPPLYLIIDEYDNFTNQLVTAHRDDLYNEITTGDSFFRTFFKVVKAGVESRAIGKVFITGVLPITIDDLTSGFNIAELITLKKQFHDMLGFTQREVDQYVETVFEAGEFDKATLPDVLQIVKENYNGYHFHSDAPNTLYNSTILTYFLKSFLVDGGEIPTDLVDPNIKTDVNWIKRLSGGDLDAPLKLLEQLVNGRGLPYDSSMLSDKFNMNRFFEKDFYPVSLFYLGMLTIKTRFDMDFPNQTLARIFVDYFNILSKIEVSKGYNEYFRQFLKDLDITALFAGYFKPEIFRIQ